MFTEVQRLTHNAMPHSLMNDFESSMLSALSQIYPDIPQAGCLFCAAKNVFRSVQDIGLQQNHLTDALFRGNICMMPALSFVLVQLLMNFLTIVVLMSSLLLIILKVITFESCEGADVCCQFSLTSCGIWIIGSLTSADKESFGRMAHSFLQHVQTNTSINLGVY